MYKIAVLGDKDSVLAFMALGIDVFIAYTKEESRDLIDRLAEKNYGVIFITEQLAAKIPNTIKRYNEKIIPAIILIPSNQGSLGIGIDNLNRNVEKAVGANIL
ncbi:V-type ATP synthase subunit F [Peptoniphilus raoultii]|uniref:V-type ATP synthase subunit F n=1 Tax=Peptoniphilus raoultii TaxID=1776387 RepID=UPI0008DA0FDF|nr:V-type ATP synthase subunit F [Peptoniphilus raoultii]